MACSRRKDAIDTSRQSCRHLVAMMIAVVAHASALAQAASSIPQCNSPRAFTLLAKRPRRRQHKSIKRLSFASPRACITAVAGASAPHNRSHYTSAKKWCTFFCTLPTVITWCTPIACSLSPPSERYTHGRWSLTASCPVHFVTFCVLRGEWSILYCTAAVVNLGANSWRVDERQ